MKKGITYNTRYLVLLLVPVLFARCGHTDPVQGGGTQTNDDPGLIRLAGSGVEVIAETRAVTDFPNNQQIAVLAAEYANGGTADWTSYADILNETATVTHEDNDLFYFNWAAPKYWPLDGSQLVFRAYSPPAPDGNAITGINAAYTELQLQLLTDMTDLLYASGNVDAETTPFSKNDERPVHLGEFRHALTKVTVKVISDETANPNIRISSLTLTTTRKTATYVLADGPNGFQLGAADTANPFVYTFDASNTDFSQTPYSADMLLFPGSQADTKIDIILADNTYSFPYTYAISDFFNAETQAYDIAFVSGENAILTITVKGTEVEQPNPDLHLQGRLTDWIDRGDFELGVK